MVEAVGREAWSKCGWGGLAFNLIAQHSTSMKMLVSREQLSLIMESASSDLTEKYLVPINETMKIFGITKPLRIAHFLAQIAHETGELKFSEEISSGAQYEGRRSLGNTQPGDGERFKGRGLLQLTGRSNYEHCKIFLRSIPKYAALDITVINGERFAGGYRCVPGRSCVRILLE